MTSTNEISKKILVTNALPYANGSIHIGHLVGYIQADIWVRYQKMKKRDCLLSRGLGDVYKRQEWIIPFITFIASEKRLNWVVLQK